MEHLACPLFALRLRELINDGAVSQTAVARECGLAVGCMSRYLAGRSEPSVSNLVALARYFQVSTDYLLGVTGQCARGRKKLPESAMRVIRRNKGRMSSYELGRMYGVSHQTIMRVWAGAARARV